MKKYLINPILLFLVSISTTAFSYEHKHQVSYNEASQSMVKARIACQKLSYTSPECMKVIKEAYYVDTKVSELCFSKSYSKLDCLQEAINKFYIVEEINICKAKSYSFLDCIRDMGTPVEIIAKKQRNSRLLGKHIKKVRQYLEEGQYNRAYGLILLIEQDLEE